MFSNNNKCIVCKAAGKSDNLDHWIRNDKGTVVCPTLLEQNCRHCGQKGHTPKYCIIKKQQERQDRRALFASAVKADNKKKNLGNKNVFGALDDSSSDEEDKMTKEEMRQTLCDILGVSRSKNAVAETTANPPAVPIKRRLWSEMMDDSDDE